MEVGPAVLLTVDVVTDVDTVTVAFDGADEPVDEDADTAAA